MKGHRLTSMHSICAALLPSLALLALLLLPSLLAAQTNGLISGTVTDKSGAAVVGAKVVITSAGGNLTRNTETNGDGVYVAPPFLPGNIQSLSLPKAFRNLKPRTLSLK